jgi:hypothetical protein
MHETVTHTYTSGNQALRAHERLRQHGWEVFSMQQIPPRLQLYPSLLHSLWLLMRPPQTRFIVTYARERARDAARRSAAE